MLLNLLSAYWVAKQCMPAFQEEAQSVRIVAIPQAVKQPEPLPVPIVALSPQLTPKPSSKKPERQEKTKEKIVVENRVIPEKEVVLKLKEEDEDEIFTEVKKVKPTEPSGLSETNGSGLWDAALGVVGGVANAVVPMLFGGKKQQPQMVINAKTKIQVNMPQPVVPQKIVSVPASTQQPVRQVRVRPPAAVHPRPLPAVPPPLPAAVVPVHNQRNVQPPPAGGLVVPVPPVSVPVVVDPNMPLERPAETFPTERPAASPSLERPEEVFPMERPAAPPPLEVMEPNMPEVPAPLPVLEMAAPAPVSVPSMEVMNDRNLPPPAEQMIEAPLPVTPVMEPAMDPHLFDPHVPVPEPVFVPEPAPVVDIPGPSLAPDPIMDFAPPPVVEIPAYEPPPPPPVVDLPPPPPPEPAVSLDPNMP